VALVVRVGGGVEPLELCQEQDFLIWSNVKTRGLHVMLKVLIKTISYRLDEDELLCIAEFVDFRLGGEFDY
jgi:hypothetical protein